MFLLVYQPPKKRYWRRAHPRRNPDGTTSTVSGHWVNGPGGTGAAPRPASQYSYSPSPPPPAPPPPPSSPPLSHVRHDGSYPRRKRRNLAIAITVTAAIAGGTVTYSVTSGGSSSSAGNVSVQANIDLGQAVSKLLKMGFAGSDNTKNGGSNSSQDCSQSLTGNVKQFLTKNPCKEYSVSSIEAHQNGISTQAAISWVVMATPDLAAHYKEIVDERHKGNPPGQPVTFNGLCYASGEVISEKVDRASGL
jgi:hypothetical protein